jgi:hypothetical protein
MALPPQHRRERFHFRGLCPGFALTTGSPGPFCGKSKRLAEELLEAGYTNVRRYQLGMSAISTHGTDWAD